MFAVWCCVWCCVNTYFRLLIMFFKQVLQLLGKYQNKNHGKRQMIISHVVKKTNMVFPPIWGVERKMQLQFGGKWSRQYCMCGGGGSGGGGNRSPRITRGTLRVGGRGAMLVLNIDLDNNCIVHVLSARFLHRPDTLFWFLFLKVLTFKFLQLQFKSNLFNILLLPLLIVTTRYCVSSYINYVSYYICLFVITHFRIRSFY